MVPFQTRYFNVHCNLLEVRWFVFKSLSISVRKLWNMVFSPSVSALSKSLLGLKQTYLSLWQKHSVLNNEINIFTGQDRKPRKPLWISTDKTQM